MDLSDVIISLLDGAPALTVTRTSPVSYGTDGRPVTSTASTFSAQMLVQPVSGRDLQRMPEGLRDQALVSAWSLTELRTKGPTQEPDTFVWKGDTWQVEQVQQWDDLGNYWKVIAMKVGTGS